MPEALNTLTNILALHRIVVISLVPKDSLTYGKGSMGLFRKDVLGHVVFLKRLLFLSVGVVTYPGLQWLNRLRISGTEYLANLRKNNVLFVSNHQTYFADVISMFHVFSSVKWGLRNSLANPAYLLDPSLNVYFVAAEETMRAGILPRILAYAGSVSVQRTWRDKNREVKRQAKMKDFSNIATALDNGWVVTFPQGTTTPFAPGRRGVTHLIRQYQPTVVPVVLNGFSKVFSKKGIRLRSIGKQLSMRFKPPLEMDYAEDPDLMLGRIMEAIEQSAPQSSTRS